MNLVNRDRLREVLFYRWQHFVEIIASSEEIFICQKREKREEEKKTTILSFSVPRGAFQGDLQLFGRQKIFFFSLAGSSCLCLVSM